MVCPPAVVIKLVVDNETVVPDLFKGLVKVNIFSFVSNCDVVVY